MRNNLEQMYSQKGACVLLGVCVCGRETDGKGSELERKSVHNV